MQWAAVKTLLVDIIEPPQPGSPKLNTAAMYGWSWTVASCPPTINAVLSADTTANTERTTIISDFILKKTVF